MTNYFRMNQGYEQNNKESWMGIMLKIFINILNFSHSSKIFFFFTQGNVIEVGKDWLEYLEIYKRKFVK